MSQDHKPSFFKKFWLSVGGLIGLVAIAALVLQAADYVTSQRDEAVIITIESDQRGLLATLVALGSTNPANEAERARIETEKEVIQSTIQAQDTLIAGLQGTPLSTDNPPIPENTPISTFTLSAESIPSPDDPLSIQTLPPIPPGVPTPTSTLEPGVLFLDDFTDGLDPAWQVVSGEWITNRGRAMPQSGCGMLLVGEPKWNNLIIDTNYMVSFRTGSFFVFAYQDESNYIRLNTGTNGDLYWETIRNGGRRTVPDTFISGYYADQPHNLVIEIDGNAIRGTIDGESVYDLHFGEPMNGAVGFSACENASSPPVFDDYKVSVLAP